MLYSPKERPKCKFCDNPVFKPYYSKSKFKKWGITCEEHYKINRKRGASHPNAIKNGRVINDQGYVMILDPSKTTGSRYVLEHRKVAEQQLGRPLTKNEVVHHANGIREDNRPENLIVIDTKKEKHESRTLINALYRVIQDLQERIVYYEHLVEQRRISECSIQ